MEKNQKTKNAEIKKSKKAKSDVGTKEKNLPSEWECEADRLEYLSRIWS